MLWLDLVAVVA